MSCRKRLTARLVGSAFVALLGTSCAELGSPFDGPAPQQADIVDHALNAAKAARANGDLNGASAKLAYLVSVAPDNAGVLAEYAKVLTQLGQPDDALVYFQRAKALDPNDWKLLNAEAVAYDEKLDYAAAQDDYAAALKLSPGEGIVINNAARSRVAAGDLRGAEALLAQANSGDRASGYLASTQSQLTALQAAQTPPAPVATTAPQPLAAAPLVNQTVAHAPAVLTAPQAPAPVQNPEAVPVAMNTTSSWTPPAVSATAPTVIDASKNTPPAPSAPAPDPKPAAQDVPPAPPVIASTSAPDSVLPSLTPTKEETKAAATPVDTKPAAPTPVSDIQPASAKINTPGVQADNHRYYIRVGTYRSRRHAWHVAARLKPRAAHVVRLTYHKHRYYRVWIANADRDDAEAMLPAVQALGYRHAHILAKLDTTRRLADAQR